MNYLDLEWRKRVREFYGFNSLLPEMYLDIWKDKLGRRIAFKIRLERLWKRIKMIFR